MTMRTVLIPAGFLIVLFAAGCAAPNDGDLQYDDATAETLEDWIGVSDRDVVLSLGAPDAVYQMQGGGRILTWRTSRTEDRAGEIYTVTETQTVDGTQVAVPVTRQKPTITWRYECVLNIEIDAGGHVVGYTREGNDCTVPAPPD